MATQGTTTKKDAQPKVEAFNAAWDKLSLELNSYEQELDRGTELRKREALRNLRRLFDQERDR